MRNKIRLLMPLIIILLVGAFLRLYKISDYMTFLGDEGRDVLIVKRMLIDHKWTLLGPTASVGGFFLGPIYYYFMLPFLWLWRLDPTGPAVMVALFGTATIYLVYLLGKVFFDQKTGLIAAALYSVSTLVIAYSHSSWNPNIAPFFSCLAILSIYQAVKEQKKRLFFLTGFWLGIGLQLHYLMTFLVVITAVYLGLKEWRNLKDLSIHYFYLTAGFLAGFSPFLLFEVRKGFPNTQTILRFIFNGGKDTGFVGSSFLGTVNDLGFRLFWRLLTHYPSFGEANLWQSPIISKWVIGITILIIFSLGLFLWQKKNLLLFLWLVLGVGLFLFYKKAVYDYYLGFLFPIPFLLVGNLIRKTKILGLIILVLLFYNAMDGVYLRYPPNRQLNQSKVISKFVLDKSNNQPFNFALIAPGNSDHTYRYFLEIWGHPPVVIENFQKDPRRQTVANQLLVICEKKDDCHPLGNSLWEIAGFGRAEIQKEWDISFVKVVKLNHYAGKL